MIHFIYHFVCYLGEEGNKPFLILVKWMNIRHVDVAFRTNRIV